MKMLMALSISCIFLPHDVPAAGDITEQLGLKPMLAISNIIVEVGLDALRLIDIQFHPTAVANRPTLWSFAVVASVVPLTTPAFHL